MVGAGTGALPAQRGGEAAGPASPPGAELTISVMTMGVGPEVWERFGHNAIVVQDGLRGTSTSYNYGMFSFRQENFLLRFLQGRMLYWMTGYPTDADVPRYIAARRSLWLQQLELAPAERLAMRDFLEWNARPANAYYRYDYYLDNCSTRVRDALDRILHGGLRAQMGGLASGDFRFHTRRLNTHNLALYTGLELILGPSVDRPVTRWDEMFLPLKLRDHLREATRPGPDGQPIPLVREERVLYQSDAWPVPDRPPTWWPGYLLAGLLAGGLLFLLGVSARRSAAARRGLLLAGSVWSVTVGVLGLVLVLVWAFTDHRVAFRNQNLLQLPVLYLGLAAILPGAIRDRPGPRRAAAWLALAIGAMSLLGVLLKAVPSLEQFNTDVLALFVPINVGLSLAILRWNRPQR
jgi:hypothetical protein